MRKLFILFLLISLVACSSKEVTQEKTDYVFDIGEPDSLNLDNQISTVSSSVIDEPYETNRYYLIQIGAFTSESRANRFAESSRKKLNEEIIVSFSDKLSLYLVQLAKKFDSKSEAEIVRDNLKSFPEFQDAWIITIK
jgi:uncharacterized lipoprotein YmbA